MVFQISIEFNTSLPWSPLPNYAPMQNSAQITTELAPDLGVGCALWSYARRKSVVSWSWGLQAGLQGACDGCSNRYVGKEPSRE